MHKQLHSDYYEGKIQIRPYHQEIMNFIENQARKYNIYISKQVKVKEGIDIYVSSNKFARIVGKKLKKSYNGELKESKKLFGKDRMSSKNLYRVTVCFRLKNE